MATPHFDFSFLALDPEGTHFLPGGGFVRMHDQIDIVDQTITMTELRAKIAQWGRNRWHTNVVCKFITPLEESDWSRTVEDWVNNPTSFQIKEQVDSENKLFQSRRGAIGKVAVNFLVG